MNDKRLIIYTPEEIKQQDKKNILFEAIGEFMLLEENFIDPQSRKYDSNIKGYKMEYYPFETLFKNRCDKNSESDPTFDIELFAVSERKRIKGILKKVESLSDALYYAEHPTYIQALKYCKFLRSYKAENSQTQKVETINKTALFMVYNGETIGKGRTKLHQRFAYYSKPVNRKGTPTNCTAKILHNKIRLFEEVIEMLPEENRARANDELKILVSRYNSME